MRKDIWGWKHRDWIQVYKVNNSISSFLSSLPLPDPVTELNNRTHYYGERIFSFGETTVSVKRHSCTTIKDPLMKLAAFHSSILQEIWPHNKFLSPHRASNSHSWPWKNCKWSAHIWNIFSAEKMQTKKGRSKENRKEERKVGRDGRS